MRVAVLGIDPGTTMSAYTLLEFIDGEFQQVSCKALNTDALARMASLCSNVDVCVIEEVTPHQCMGQTVLDTCRWSGRFQQFAEAHPGIRRVEMRSRLSVKQHILGTGRGTDADIRAAMIDRYGSPGTKREPGLLYGVAHDMWQSLAIASATMDALLEGRK